MRCLRAACGEGEGEGEEMKEKEKGEAEWSKRPVPHPTHNQRNSIKSFKKMYWDSV